MISIPPPTFPFNFQEINKFYTNNINSIPEEISIQSDEINLQTDGISIESDEDHISFFTDQPKETDIQETDIQEEMEIQEDSTPLQKLKKTSRRTQKVGRSYIPQGPNITRTEEERLAGFFDDKNVIRHAGNRIVDFLLSSEVLWELNLTSTPGEKRELVVSILSALYQGEKGVTKKQKKGEPKHKKAHGGHDNAAAGLDINLRSSLMDRIVIKGEVTPKTQKIMKYRGFTTKDLEEIKENFDKTNVEEVFKRVWSAHPKRPNYLFEGTKINEKVNRITEISIDVNLFVDKKLESYIRVVIKKLYEKILDGVLTPREATKEYVASILYFFTKLENNLKTILNLVEEYQKEFALIDFDEISAEKCKVILNNLNRIIQKMCPAKPKKINTQVKSAKKGKKGKGSRKKKSQVSETEVSPPSSTSQTDSPKPSFNPRMIRMNKKFINLNNLEGDKPELLPNMLKGVQNWGIRRGPALLEEMKNFYTQIETYVKSVALEKEGTADIDDDQYTALFGEFNPKSGKREVTDASIEAARARLWAPPTPPNKRPLEEEKKVPNPKPIKMRRLSLN
jgi:hypothetical protein